MTTITIQQSTVAELIRKIRYSNELNFTHLHDHERITLAEYILENDPENPIAETAIQNKDFDIDDLAIDAERIIRKSFPSILELWN